MDNMFINNGLLSHPPKSISPTSPRKAQFFIFEFGTSQPLNQIFDKERQTMVGKKVGWLLQYQGILCFGNRACSNH